MKVSVLEYKIDEDKLLEEISRYEVMNEVEAYLFMNKYTMNTLIKASNVDFPPSVFCEKTSKGFTYGMYRGTKCYINNDLPFGEVEIR